MSTNTRQQGLNWRQIAVLIPLFPLVLAIALFALLLYIVASICLHIVIWLWWCLRGRDILFMYSDSPIWHDYIEQRILPFLGERAVILNWSHRKKWRFSLARLAFHHFGGFREVNSLGGVFRPFLRTPRVRFWP